jgi:hypothetical protein
MRVPWLSTLILTNWNARITSKEEWMTLSMVYPKAAL